MIENKLDKIINSAITDNKDNWDDAKWTTISTMAGEEYLKHCPEINDRNDIISKRDSVTYQRALICAIG